MVYESDEDFFVSNKTFYYSNYFVNDNFIIFYDPVGIKEIHNPKPKISVYPNPATSSVSLMFTDKTNLTDNEVFVYDVYGQLVKQFNPENIGTKLIIQVADLEKGVYFVKVGGAVGKFVKR